MHIVAIVIAFAVCIAGYVYILKSIQEQLQIQHEINLKLPPDQQFEPSFWGYGTNERFRQLQRELLPDSSRPRRLRKFRLIGFAALFSGTLILFAIWSSFHG
jgi:hypothetical protein